MLGAAAALRSAALERSAALGHRTAHRTALLPPFAAAQPALRHLPGRGGARFGPALTASRHFSAPPSAGAAGSSLGRRKGANRSLRASEKPQARTRKSERCAPAPERILSANQLACRCSGARRLGLSPRPARHTPRTENEAPPPVRTARAAPPPRTHLARTGATWRLPAAAPQLRPRQPPPALLMPPRGCRSSGRAWRRRRQRGERRRSRTAAPRPRGGTGRAALPDAISWWPAGGAAAAAPSPRQRPEPRDLLLPGPFVSSFFLSFFPILRMEEKCLG